MLEKKARKRSSIFIRLAGLIIPFAFLLHLSQTAFAQNTYVITDGDRVLYHTSYTTDPAEVLNEAGLVLGADDTYTATAGSGISEINVQRSHSVTIDNCGKVLQVAARGETVTELLSRLGIPVNDSTSVSVPLDAQTYEGMMLTVSRTVRNVEVYTVTLPHEVVYCNDDSLPQGQTTVLTKGVDGQITCTASVVYVNGKEINRTVLSQTVLQQPVNEVVAVGTGAAEPKSAAASSDLVIGDGYLVTPSGEILTYTDTLQMKATAYTHTDPGCNEVTATGTIVRVGTVAVDPALIPYGTRMFIITNDGKYIYGTATAEDCGGSIKQNRIDLYFPTESECLSFGRRDCTVFILGEAEIVRES